MKNIEFRHIRDDFQDQLQEDKENQQLDESIYPRRQDYKLLPDRQSYAQQATRW